MPRKLPAASKPWRISGISVGFIRGGIYYIDRTLPGRPRFKRSTGRTDRLAAEGEYREFERDPAGYVQGRSRAALWDDAVKRYLRYSALTAQNSPLHVARQADYFANLHASGRFHSIHTFTASDVRAFMAWRANGGVGGRKVGRPAVNRDLAALKALMSWARLERLTANLADTEVPQLQEDQGTNAPREIPEKDWTAVNRRLLELWRLACEVLLGTGLRYGELARMAAGDLRPGGLHVPKAKRRKARTVPISIRTVNAAKKLLKAGGVPDDAASQLDHRLRVACRAAGVTFYSAHELRHTYATFCLRSGVPLRDLQYRLGHASIRTTEKYLHALAAQGRHRNVGAPL